MRHLRPALARFLTVWLVAAFVMGSVGLGAAGAGAAVEPAHMAGHAEAAGDDCPTAAEASVRAEAGHGACAMTVCCFSEGDEPGAQSPDFVLMPAIHVLSAEPRLTQAEPEGAKKPPRLT